MPIGVGVILQHQLILVHVLPVHLGGFLEDVEEVAALETGVEDQVAAVETIFSSFTAVV